MAADVIFPTNEKLSDIAQEKLPALEADREIFKIFPIRNQDEWEYSWEQLDRFKGLQKIRGLNSEPTRVKQVGINRFQAKPGVYGEFQLLEEDQLARARSMGTFGKPIDLTELVLRAQDLLLQRRLDRIEAIGWLALTTNTFSVAAPSGAIMHTDTFNFRTFTSAVGWTTPATSTPLNDFRTVTLLHRGYSVSFDSSATAYMNRTTYYAYINNTNTNDLFGRRTMGLGTINNVTEINKLMQGDDLPMIKIYDNTYLDENENNVLFIPDGKVVLVGKRPGNVPVGGYIMTRNISNPSFTPGAYTRVVDSASGENNMNPIPRKIAIHDGHNGGPAVEYPSSVVIMTVY